MLQSPTARPVHRPLASRFPWQAVVCLQRAVQSKKAITPTHSRSELKRQSLLRWIREELMNPDVGRQGPTWLACVQNGERKDDGASPGGHLVNIDRRP